MPAATTAPGLDPARQAHSVGGVLDLGRSRDEQGVGVHLAPVEGARHRLHLEQRQLRRREHDDVELVAGRGIAAQKVLDLAPADGDAGGAARRGVASAVPRR